MTDPNVYWGSGKGGTQIGFCNVVAAFGVDNTGATDCGPAINTARAALASSAGQVAWFPAGTYQVNTPIVQSVTPMMMAKDAVFSGSDPLMQAWLTQEQPTTGGIVPIRLLPYQVTGSAPFSWVLGTEVGDEGAINPALFFGYNADAVPGKERCLWVIEQNYQNAGPIYDTETHIEFFDGSNVLVARAFSSTYWLPPAGGVDGYCETSIGFRDGTGSGATNGSFTINETIAGQLVRCESSFWRWEVFGRVGWAGSVTGPLLTQDDNTASNAAYPMTFQPGRANFSGGGSDEAASFVINLRSPSGSAPQPRFTINAETAYGNNTYLDILDVYRDVSDSSTIFNVPNALELQSGGVTCLALQNAGAGIYLWTQLINSPSAPSFTPTGGPILFGSAGAAKVKGTSGTVTTFGPAEPHCPKCGSDFMTEHENPKYGYLAVCLKCMADHLGEQPWIIRQKP